MGTINYGRSDFLNIGFNLSDEWNNMDEDEQEDTIYFVSHDVQEMIDDLGELKYFRVGLEYGYYEGFYIELYSQLENINHYLDRQDANKEVTAIGKFLTACANIGLVKYSPWWCTTYFSRNETMKAIRDAVKAMRQAVHDQPTFRQYERMNNA